MRIPEGHPDGCKRGVTFAHGRCTRHVDASQMPNVSCYSSASSARSTHHRLMFHRSMAVPLRFCRPAARFQHQVPPPLCTSTPYHHIHHHATAPWYADATLSTPRVTLRATNTVLSIEHRGSPRPLPNNTRL
eukprot:366450-Chlamydomonas_euryale.AAC.7